MIIHDPGAIEARSMEIIEAELQGDLPEEIKPIVKRVIALEGQTVDIDFDAGIVYVDGSPLQEDYVNSLTLEPEDFTEPVTVPEGCIFVMGDNRNRSADSRSARLGCVDTRCIIGKALWRIAPLGKFGTVYA